MTQKNQLDQAYKILVVMALVIFGIVLLRDIVIPIAFAALFSIVLLPLERKLEKKTGRILSIMICLLGAFAAIGLIVWFVISQISSLVASLPDLTQKFDAVNREASRSIREMLDLGAEDPIPYINDGLQHLTNSLGDVLLSTSYLVYFFIQVPIYIFLFLLYRDKFKTFFLNFTVGEELIWQKDVEGVVQGYIGGMTIVILIAGILNSIGLLILGIQHAIFFGFLSGALTMIPYVGITIGATLPALVALVTKDSAWYAVGVIGVHGFVQFLEGNFITPKITGSRISINALAAILALLIGGELLGIAGMILAIPAVGTLRILLSYSKTFRPFVILLDGSPTKSKDTLPEPLPDPPSQ